MKAIKVAVIGAGMSGMVAAIFAARGGCEVTLFDGNNAPGKKILKTGSGRCNFSNFNQDISHFHTSSESKVSRILQRFDLEDTLNFFKEIGVEKKREGDLFYPYSNQAKSVRDALVMTLESLGVDFKMQTRVEDVFPSEGTLKVVYGDKKQDFDRVIISTGGLADPKSGSDGFGLHIAGRLGDIVLDTYPSLVPLVSSDRELKKASGIRIDAIVTLKTSKGRFTQKGNLQITDFGISGICTMQLSRLVGKELKQKKPVEAELDFAPDLNHKDLKGILASRFNMTDRTDAYLAMIGFLPDKLINPVLKKAGINTKSSPKSINKDKLDSLIKAIKNYTLEITETKGYEFAQTTLGGVDLDNLTGSASLESKAVGVFYCGEVLDVCGDCGGYNLQWAISSGAVAGMLSAGNNGV